MGKDSKSDHKKSSKSERKHKDHKHHKSSERRRSDSSESDSNGNKITELDYFLKIDEYRVWLKLSKSLTLENITS